MLDTEKIEKLITHVVVADVNADTGMAKLLCDKQEKTCAAANIQNFLRRRAIESQPPHSRQVSLEPAFCIGVFRIHAGRKNVPLLDLAQTVLVNSLQETADAE